MKFIPLFLFLLLPHNVVVYYMIKFQINLLGEKGTRDKVSEGGVILLQRLKWMGNSCNSMHHDLLSFLISGNIIVKVIKALP